MSFWTDVRDTFTAPFRAVGDWVSDIASGENVFESTGKFVSKEFTAMWTLSDPNFALAQTDVGQEALNSKIANALTVGVSGDLAKTSKYGLDSATGIDPTWVTFRDAAIAGIDGSAKIGIAVASGGAAGAAAGAGGAGAYAVGAATVGGAYAGAQGVQKLNDAVATGDFAGIVSSATNIYNSSGGAGGLDLPDISDTVDAANQAVEDAQNVADIIRGAAGDARGAAGQAQSLVDLVKSNTPAQVRGYASSLADAASDNPGTSLALLAGAGLVAYLLLRGK